MEPIGLPPAELPEPLQRFDSAAAELVEQIARIDAANVRYQEQRQAGRILPNVVEAMRVELTYHSNAIEGNTLSLRETQLVIEGRTPDGGRSMREIYEARNHDRAVRMIDGWSTQRPASAPLAEQDLLDVHAQVLADIDPAMAGRFRRERVLIAGTGFVPPGAQKFDVLIPAMLELANRPSTHPVIQAAELHYNLVAIHPFSDGNGRTARLMMNYHLVRRGFPYAIIEVTHRGEYLAALDAANNGQVESFARFIARSVENSLRRALGPDD